MKILGHTAQFEKFRLGAVALGIGLLMTLLLPVGVHASTQYYYPSYATSYSSGYSSTVALQARLQALIAEVQRLQAELLRIRGQGAYQYPSRPLSSDCYSGSDRYYYADCTTSHSGNLRRIDVTFLNNYARVEVSYQNGRATKYNFDGETREEVIDFLVDEIDYSYAEINSVIRFTNDERNNYSSNDDVESVDVVIRDGDARVTVRYDDDTTERFTLNNEEDEDDIITKVADRLDRDESDVEDVIDFTDEDSNSNDDVDTIRVTIDRDNEEATARVRYDDDSTDTFDYDTDVKSEIVSDLADDLNISESDVRDVVTYTYN